MTKSSKKRFSLKKIALVAGAVVAISGSFGVVRRVVNPGELVVSVIDGDSFKIGRDQTIRLSSLDAPEGDFCSGGLAKNMLTRKIEGKKVYLKEMQTDRYGRIMAMVYLKNGEFVNEYMVKNGLAIHIWDTGTQNKVLDRANDFARENKLGIFSRECYQETPPDPDCAIKGNILQDSKAREYTYPGCRLYNLSIIEKYKGEEWFCTESQAKKAGYVRSGNCK